MDEQSIFFLALEQKTSASRAEWLSEVCGNDLPLKARVEALLQNHLEANSFLEQPPVEFGATILTGPADPDLAASLEAGLAASFGENAAVVIGNAGHSVLKALGRDVDVPRVMLRELAADGADPIARPKSLEMPQPNSDSRYQLQGEIARGGMGAILKGRDMDLGRDLAIKVLLDQHKDKPEVIQRFVEEAQIGGQLQHPGIAPIYELGQFADKRPFFAMKLVKGDTLSKLLADRTDPISERGKFIGIFEQICQTMAYAHSRGVIHRDLKPANIMVGAFGEVQVMDWGLAKVLQAGGVADEKKAYDQQKGQSVIQTLRSKVGSDTPGTFGTYGSQTQIGSVMGTPAYMPPEQALGEIDHLNERADVFGLGAILCEILTGKPPYIGDDGTQVFRMASRGKLTDCLARLDASGADAELIALTKHCLELEPKDRPRDARELAERVSDYLESVESRLRAAEVERAAEAARADAQTAQAAAERRRAEAESARAREEIKRRRTSLALAASVVLLVGLGSGGWLYLLHQEADRQTTEADAQRQHAREMDQQRKVAVQAQQTAEESLAKAERAEQVAREFAKAEEQAKAHAQRETLRAVAEQKRAEQQLARSDQLVYTSKLILAQNDFETGNGGLSQRYLDECQSELRGWEHRYLSARIPSQQTLRGHTDEVRSAAFSPDGKCIVTGSLDGTARVWDAATGLEVLALKTRTQYVLSAAFSPDCERIVTGGGDWGDGQKPNEVKVWDARTGKVLHELQGHNYCVWSVAFSPDGKRIVTGASDWGNGPGEVKVWDALTGQIILDLKGHPHQVVQTTFSPDSKRIVTACWGATAKVWDAETGQEILALNEPNDQILGVVFSPDGRRIVTGSWGGTPKVWNAETGQTIFALNGHKAQVRGVAFSSDGKRIVTVSHDQTTKVWDAETGRELLTLKGHADYVNSAAFSPDGKRVVTASRDKTVKVWDAEKGQEIPTLRGHNLGVNRIAFRPDGKRIVTGSADCTAKVWDTVTGRQLLSLGSPGDWTVAGVWGVAFSPDGNRIVTASEDKTVRIWDAETGKELLTFKGHTAAVRGVAFSPDGKRIASGSNDETIKVWDAETGQEFFTFKGRVGFVTPLAFSPDGQCIVTTSSDHQAKVWHAATGQEILALKGHAEVINGIAFSTDGKRIATTSQDQTAKVWNAATGEEILILKGHTGEVRGVAFSPDGTRIVTGSDDRTARVWDAVSGLEVLPLGGHADPVWSVAWSPDGQRIVTACKGRDQPSAMVWYAESFPKNNLWPLPGVHERILFHSEQAELSKRGNRSFETEFHLRQVAFAETELINSKRFQSLVLNEFQPQDDAERQALAAHLSKRATEYVATEQWELAKADWLRIIEQPGRLSQAFETYRKAERWHEATEFGRKLIEQNPKDSTCWIWIAPVIVFSKDKQAYTSICKSILQQSCEAPELADRAIKVCLLQPGMVDLAELPGKALASALDNGTVPEWFPPYGWNSRALLAYRSGDPEAAVKYIAKSEEFKPVEFVRVLNLAILAMAQQQLKHPQEAKAALEDATSIITRLKTDPTIKGHPDLQIAEIVFREADALINSQPAAKPAGEKKATPKESQP